MVKTFLISSVVLTLFFGAAGVSIAKAKETQRGAPVTQADIEGEQIRSTVNNELQTQTREQLSLGPAVSATVTPSQDCDGTPDRDQDRLQAHDRDRIHQPEADDGNDSGNQHGNRP